MDELIEALKKAQASSFAFYLKAHNYHWNVEGHSFSEYHTFLGGLYEEVFGAVDTIAELIRTLDAYAPGSLSRFHQLSVIEDELLVPKGMIMMGRLYADNQKMLVVLREAYRIAEAANSFGVSNAFDIIIILLQK